MGVCGGISTRVACAANEACSLASRIFSLLRKLSKEGKHQSARLVDWPQMLITLVSNNQNCVVLNDTMEG